jgi:hypothetical protein
MDGIEPASQVLLAWWESRRGSRRMPLRSELDPADLKRILPSMLLLDVRPGAEQGRHVFGYRLVGTEIDQRFAARLTGLTLDDAPLGEVKPSIQAQYEMAVREMRPIFCSHEIVVNDSRHLEYQRLVVPLGAEGLPGAPLQVTALAAAVDFHCGYLLSRGRPDDCPHQTFCDRIDLCTSPQLFEACW